MDPENSPSQEPVAAPGGAWHRRRRLTLGLTAVALVAGGGVAIAAGAPDDPQPTQRAAETAVPAPGQSRGGVLHSETVTSDGNGGYVTHLMQAGKIESVDDNGLTVVSDDGYKRAWKRTSDTVVGGANWSVTKNDDGSWTVRKSTEALATGQQVLVLGTLDGDQATAQRIAAKPDLGDLPPMVGKRFGGDDAAPGLTQRMPGMPGRMDGPGGTVRKFEFRTGPNGEGGMVTSPGPGEPFGYGGSAPAPQTPGSGAAPAEPSTVYRDSGSVSFT